MASSKKQKSPNCDDMLFTEGGFPVRSHFYFMNLCCFCDGKFFAWWKRTIRPFQCCARSASLMLKLYTVLSAWSRIFCSSLLGLGHHAPADDAERWPSMRFHLAKRSHNFAWPRRPCHRGNNCVAPAKRTQLVAQPLQRVEALKDACMVKLEVVGQPHLQRHQFSPILLLVMLRPVAYVSGDPSAAELQVSFSAGHAVATFPHGARRRARSAAGAAWTWEEHPTTGVAPGGSTGVASRGFVGLHGLLLSGSALLPPENSFALNSLSSKTLLRCGVFKPSKKQITLKPWRVCQN